jgi:hypothetical protein
MLYSLVHRYEYFKQIATSIFRAGDVLNMAAAVSSKTLVSTQQTTSI